jgi:hypothetical protein
VKDKIVFLFYSLSVGYAAKDTFGVLVFLLWIGLFATRLVQDGGPWRWSFRAFMRRRAPAAGPYRTAAPRALWTAPAPRVLTELDLPRRGRRTVI